MFSKVKAKFIAISTIITAIILLFISGGIYFSIRGQTNRNNAQILDMICSHSSNFKFWNGTGWDQQGGWEGGDYYGGQYSYTSQDSEQTSEHVSQEEPPAKPDDKKDKKQEPPQTAQYFTVVYADNMFRTEDVYNTDHITSIDEEEAKAIVELIKASNKDEGTINKYYRFKVADLGNDVKGVGVLDIQQSLKSVETVRNYSLIFGSSGLVIMFALLYFLSDAILKPVKESYEKQKNFISNASHELRTPLTIISANNELIEMQNGQTPHTENISKQIKKMNDMVAGLTTLSKITDPDNLELKLINVSNVADEICINYEHIFEEAGLKFEHNVEKDINFKSNEKLLSQLIYILLDNASKYAKDNVRISIRMNKGILTIQQENEVEEIEQGDLSHYADRFYRSEDVRGKIEGSGIGLSIAKEIVDLFKGKMEIKGIYNRFTIEIEIHN